MDKLISQLINQGYLKTPEIISAFEKINRKDFIPVDLKAQSEVNSPLPIGYGQTISQPLTVAFMFELLQPEKGQEILDIGSGSGWTTAMLSEVVGSKGKVYAIERIKELKEFGEENTRKYNFVNKGIANFICGDGTKGLKEQAPFDRIIVSAAAAGIPEELKRQLKVRGRLVIPTDAQDIRLFIKKDEDEFDETIFPGFVFVPLIKN